MKKFLKLALFGFLMVGTIGCSETNEINNDLNIEQPAEFIVPKLAVRKLASGTDSDGHNFVKFNYTISPSNATDLSIITTLSWVDSSVQDTMSSYLTVSTDESDNSITLTCLQDFSHQANLNVRSASNAECYVDIPIDYEIRTKSFNWSELAATSSYTLNGQTVQPWWYGTADSLTVIVANEQYSIYSSQYQNINSYTSSNLFFNFAFGDYCSRAAVLSNGTVNNVADTFTQNFVLDGSSFTVYFHDMQHNGVVTSNPNLEGKIEDFFDGLLTNLFYTSSTKTITASAFKDTASAYAAANFSSQESSDCHSLLVELQFTINVTFTASSGYSETVGLYFWYYIDGAFWDISVTSLSSESPAITF